jgi:hypothetical protein
MLSRCLSFCFYIKPQHRVKKAFIYKAFRGF